MTKQNSVFYVKAKISYKESTRRTGGHFSYVDINLTNQIVEVKGNKAFIHTKNGVVVKMVSGKYFSLEGKSVTKKNVCKIRHAVRLRNSE